MTSASCSICPLSRRSDSIGHLSSRFSTPRLNWERAIVVLNLLIERPYTLDQLDFESILKIIIKYKSPISNTDVGNDWNNPVVRDLIDIASDVFLVVDNDPIATQNFFEQRIFPTLFKENRLKETVTVIMNKSTDKIVQDETFEGVYDDIISFPYISEEKIFSHISDRRWLLPLITNEVEAQLYELALYFLPEELLQKHKFNSWLYPFLYNNALYSIINNSFQISLPLLNLIIISNLEK